MASPTKTISLPYQWKARPHQVHAWNYFTGGGLRAVLCWPRRHGKDEVVLRHTSCAMGERKGNYWYLLPKYEQCRLAIWEAINEETGVRRIDEIFPPPIRTLFREQEMILGMGGSTFQLLGADNFHRLVGSPPVGLGFSEFARTDPAAWGYLMPIVEKNGGWVAFNSTPFGDNHYKEFCEFAEQEPGWFFEKLTADQCDIYTADQLQRILRQLQTLNGEDYGRALWLQEYFCAFDAAIPGAIWGDCVDRAKKEGRIHPFAVDRALPVFTAWDIGRVDDTAIWFYQLLGREILIVDYHASSLKDIAFYVDLLAQKQDEYGIRYATHWIPHDARPRTLPSGAGSTLQQFNEAVRRNPKLGQFAIVKRLDRQEGIQAARATFPYCHFHDTRCDLGLKSLRHYHRVWDADKKRFEDAPYHDWSSHAADAFRYLSLSWKFARPEQPDSPLADRLAAQNVRGWTFGEWKSKYFAGRRQAREEAGVYVDHP